MEFDFDMPDFYKRFLENLSDQEADKFWEYLDSNSELVHDSIETIAQSHLELAKQVAVEIDEREKKLKRLIQSLRKRRKRMPDRD